ncbi:MAG: HD domain-containing protein [Zoogloea sp.]|nr:HD domain-containing protein [Zoogloea sp.]
MVFPAAVPGGIPFCAVNYGFYAASLVPTLESALERLKVGAPDLVRLSLAITAPSMAEKTLMLGSDGLHLLIPADWLADLDPCPESLGGVLEEWTGRRGTRIRILQPLGHSARPDGFLCFEMRADYPPDIVTMRELHRWAPLVAQLLDRELSAIQALVGTVRLAHAVTSMRDLETGTHVSRMGHYANLLSRQLASTHGLPDTFVDEVTLFAPLHDIGKIGIPDAILLKPGKFEAAEWEGMKTHVIKGMDLVTHMVRDFGLEAMPQVATLRDIVACHHEYLDGSGYPAGLSGDAIPLAARVVATADIFDALTCQRPYKRPWSVDEAYAQLQELSGDKLDTDCVDAFASCRTEVDAIRAGEPALMH